MNSPRINEVSSPSKRNRMKSMTNSDIKNKYSELQENKPYNIERVNRSQHKAATTLITKKNRDTYSSYDKSDKGDELSQLQQTAQSDVIAPSCR